MKSCPNSCLQLQGSHTNDRIKIQDFFSTIKTRKIHRRTWLNYKHPSSRQYMKIKISNLVYVKHIRNYSKLSTNVTGKNYGFSITVFQDNTSKNQDFFVTLSTHVQFQDFSGPEKRRVKFHHFSELFRNSGNPEEAAQNAPPPTVDRAQFWPPAAPTNSPISRPIWQR